MEDLLEQARQEIDVIDCQMVALLEKRLKAVELVAAAKLAKGLPVFDAEREKQVERVRTEWLQNPAYTAACRSYFHYLMALSKTQQSLLCGNIYLIGLPGSGKSTLAPLVAAQIGLESLDCDAMLRQAQGCSIEDIFASQGEQAFRAYERQILEQVAARRGCVVATGGGAVLSSSNVALMRSTGIVVLLARPFADILADTEVGSRPVVANVGSLQALNRERAHLYHLAAHIIFENQGMPKEDAIALVDDLYFSVVTKGGLYGYFVD